MATTITEKFKNGFLVEIRNPNGTKMPVVVTQAAKPQANKPFVARNTKTNAFVSSGKDAESLARRLAKKGHKKVTLRD